MKIHIRIFKNFKFKEHNTKICSFNKEKYIIEKKIKLSETQLVEFVII